MPSYEEKIYQREEYKNPSLCSLHSQHLRLIDEESNFERQQMTSQTTTVIFSRARTQFGKSSWQRFSTLARKASLWFGS